MPLRWTRTVGLGVTSASFKEIRDKLLALNHVHAVMDSSLDMSGIELVENPQDQSDVLDTPGNVQRQLATAGFTAAMVMGVRDLLETVRALPTPEEQVERVLRMECVIQAESALQLMSQLVPPPKEGDAQSTVAGAVSKFFGGLQPKLAPIYSREDRRIAKICVFGNGMVAVADQYDKQMVEYQGRWEEERAAILRDKPPDVEVEFV